LNETCALPLEGRKFKIYPACEHLMVVGDALPEVFPWFSSLAH